MESNCFWLTKAACGVHFKTAPSNNDKKDDDEEHTDLADLTSPELDETKEIDQSDDDSEPDYHIPTFSSTFLSGTTTTFLLCLSTCIN